MFFSKERVSEYIPFERGLGSVFADFGLEVRFLQGMRPTKAIS